MDEITPIHNDALDNSTVDASSKIETIKNLIFGENIKAYDSEFDTLKKDLEAKRQELKDYIEDVNQELNTLIDNLSTDLNIRLTELEDKFNERANQLDDEKMDRAKLGDLLVKMGENIRK